MWKQTFITTIQKLFYGIGFGGGMSFSFYLNSNYNKNCKLKKQLLKK